MADYISRDAVFKGLLSLEPVYRRVSPQKFVSGYKTTEVQAMIQQLPAAEVVSYDCYARILSENDTMREMLAQIGKKPGDKMDDVRIVKCGEWEHISLMTCRCSVCKEVFHELEGDNICPNCGADMRETGR